jgi:shikimate dehydrogenase
LKEINELAAILSTKQNLIGLNVTVPYKQSVVPFLHTLHGAAAELRTVNTIARKADEWHGYNTDVIGFAHVLSSYNLRQCNAALLLGSGGSSLAVQYVLNQHNIPYTVVSRTKKESIDSITYDQLTYENVQAHSLIIQCTPVGMYPRVNECVDFPFAFLSAQHTCIDLIYNPAKTCFLQRAESRGCRIINGYEMLLSQAEAAWQIWEPITT